MKHIKPQASTKGLVAHYKLWSGTVDGTNVFDYSQNGFNGIPSGTDIAPAYPGFRFNGNDDFIDITASGPSSVKTVVLWINPDDVAGNNGLIALGAANLLGLVTTDITRLAGFAGGTIYVDGVAGIAVSANWHMAGVTIPAGAAADGLKIGEAAFFMDGLIGEAMLYDTVLTDAEMKSVYELTKWRYPNN